MLNLIKVSVFCFFLSGSLCSQTMAELMQHLNEAARTNNADYIDQLVEMGVDVNQTIWNDETPLMLAISNNSVEAVKLMVAKGADISLTDYSGSSPLMYAVDVNNLEIVEFLLEKGADINHRNSSGLSPFIIAVEHNNEDMAKFLIKNGADISPSAKYPQINPLAYAIRNDNPMLAKLLVEMGSELTGPVLDALADKVRSKYAKGFEAMLAAEARKNGINFMILGDNYPSFLNLALSKNALRFMDLLIDGGMKPDLFIYQGRTILMDAVILGNVDAVRLLLKKGADVNKRTNNGATAMYFAEQSGNNEIIDLLKPSFVEEVDREALYNVKMTELNETRHNAMIRSQVRASMEAYAFGMVGVNKSDEELLEAFLDKAVKDMEMGVNTGISILLSPEGESFLSLVEPSLDLKGSSILKYTQMMNAIRDYRGYISTYAGVEHKVPNFMLIKQNKLNDITKSVRTFRIAGR